MLRAVQRWFGRRADPDQWWVDHCLSTFDFLVRDYRYQLERVELHFRGNFIWYTSAVFQLSLEYFRPASRVGLEIWVISEMETTDHPRFVHAWRLLERRVPDGDWAPPTKEDFTRESVSAKFVQWANGLRDYAPDVLQGRWPPDAEWEILW